MGQRFYDWAVTDLTEDRPGHSHPSVHADLQCKHTTGFLTVAYQRLGAMQQQWLDKNPDVDKDREALLARQTRIAETVLNGTL
ncbi:hypothetical protein NLX86_20555 [Streptomyces sp. A3M-1-3]|uniref:hypothetical protein n=1 Tax=Streptomyces sp. A3M-1-3 TaxID=2962044 RepID=UPI0020B90229|nr:hypothetical protein [Streptomyces sp. A3M-1-3]MCP3820400.1 hypothetical protein [Streptomyces sp. A3M-1-3]